METWLIPGGAGFIGSTVVRRALAEPGVRVVVLDKLTYAGHLENLAEVAGDPRFQFVRGDIADPATVEAVFREHRPLAVLNLAAETHVDRSIDAPHDFVRTNVAGVLELLEASRRLLDRAPAEERDRFRFLQVSTDEVYGSLGETGSFTEQSPFAPNSPYAASKAGADHLVRSYGVTYRLPVLVTHASNNYGPYQFPEKLIPLIVRNAVEGRTLPIYGDGLYVRDWIHVEDHAEALVTVLRRGRPGRRYNVGAHTEKANLDLVDRICDVLERLRPAAENPALRGRGAAGYRALKEHVEDRRGHDRRYAVDATRLRTELGWEPRHRFDEAIVETVRWYLDHRDWCETVERAGRYRRERLGTT